MSVSVTAPSRIHFGLFGGKSQHERSFGGLGVMVDQPGLQLSIQPASEMRYEGLQSQRTKQFTESWLRFTGHTPSTAFHVVLHQCPESHIGLGTGTQLGLAVAAGLFQFCCGETPAIETVAESVGRGKRSGVGTYGFLHGGLIVDRGKTANEKLAGLDLHLPFPEDWRFVLIKSEADSGLSGTQEENFFTESTESLIGKRNQLIEIAKSQIVPAVIKKDFDTFSQAVYQFGKTSGSYFSKVQGGPFNGRRITEIITRLREFGFMGVGQSSWGPTVYAVAKSDNEANRISELMSIHLSRQETMIVTRPSRGGATISVHSELSPTQPS